MAEAPYGACTITGLTTGPSAEQHSGGLDSARLPKELWYYLKSRWTQEPMVHLRPLDVARGRRQAAHRHCGHQLLFRGIVPGRTFARRSKGRGPQPWPMGGWNAVPHAEFSRSALERRRTSPSRRPSCRDQRCHRAAWRGGDLGCPPWPDGQNIRTFHAAAQGHRRGRAFRRTLRGRVGTSLCSPIPLWCASALYGAACPCYVSLRRVSFPQGALPWFLHVIGSGRIFISCRRCSRV